MTQEIIERLNVEVAVMSYIINYHPDDVPINAKDFKFSIIKDIFEWWHDEKYIPSRKISDIENEIVELCCDVDYTSCGYSSFLVDCQALKEWED